MQTNCIYAALLKNIAASISSSRFLANFNTPLIIYTMKKTTLITAAVLVMAMVTLVAFTTKEKSVSTSSATVSQLTANWERAKTYTKEYLDAASEETFNYKPTAEMRSFGQQMMHIAQANYGIGASAIGKASPVAFGQLEKSDKTKSKAEVTKAVMESYDFVIAGMKTMNDQQLQEMVKVFNFDMNKGLRWRKHLNIKPIIGDKLLYIFA
jgi:uncharacterized membrane protein YeiB